MENLTPSLKIIDSLPDGFLDAPTNELYRVLPGPSLLRIPGKESPPIFISTLLHGNETTGIQAIQRLLKKYHIEKTPLPRELILFIGNVEAARENLRRFSWQPDYNRIWDKGSSPENQLAQKVIFYLKQEGVFASIDIHNTSGKNPHYACINKLETPFIALAKMFSQIIVYFTRPKGVLSSAMAEFCPSITIESGQPGDPYGIQHVYEFLEKCFNLKHIPSLSNPQDDLYVYHTVARIHVPENSSIGFNGDCDQKDFCFIPNLDEINFSELPEDALLGHRLNSSMKLQVFNEQDQNVESRYIKYAGDEIRLLQSVVPSMFTTNEKIVHQDCLGYLMERYSLPNSISQN